MLAGHLRRLSTYDGLTGVLNRRSIGERLREELERAHRHELPLSVALCDIDRFKSVNDTYGHLVGDSVLCEISTRLARGLRTSDVLGRWGGEEFLVIFPHSDLDSARTVAQRICSGLAEEELTTGAGEELSLRVTASFGVACNCEVDAEGAEDSLLALADRRLYGAKASGRSCVKP
jgi:diguanylate cyclase (GGDEF)-like protein